MLLFCCKKTYTYTYKSPKRQDKTNKKKKGNSLCQTSQEKNTKLRPNAKQFKGKKSEFLVKINQKSNKIKNMEKQALTIHLDQHLSCFKKNCNTFIHLLCIWC